MKANRKLKIIEGGKGRIPQRSEAMSLSSEDAEPYEPISNFLVPVDDSKGRSARVIARVPLPMKHNISVLIQSGNYPWQTESDVVRWCIHTGLEKLAKEATDPEFTSLQSILSAMVAAARVEQELSHFASSIEQVASAVQALVEMRALPPARKLVQDVNEKIDALSHPYWKNRFRAEVSKKFSFLFDKKKSKKAKGKGKDRGRVGRG